MLVQASPEMQAKSKARAINYWAKRSGSIAIDVAIKVLEREPPFIWRMLFIALMRSRTWTLALPKEKKKKKSERTPRYDNFPALLTACIVTTVEFAGVNWTSIHSHFYKIHTSHVEKERERRIKKRESKKILAHEENCSSYQEESEIYSVYSVSFFRF